MSKKTIEQRYKKLTQREHVLLRPGTYIGNNQNELRKVFIADDSEYNENIKIINKIVSYNPGFVKCFDEILTNAADHYLRTKKVKYIKVNVFEDHIEIMNDGPGIPVEMHKEHKIYVPEMLFGNLLTGENFDEDDERDGAGQNGLGSKLTNIYSKRFIVETADGKNKYIQEFSENLSKIGKPKITKLRKNYTKIIFYPDFERFGLEKNNETIQKLLLRRVLDIAAYCPKLDITYNGEKINIKSFSDYSKLYLEEGAEIFYERLNDDWEIVISEAQDNNFQQVSLVNSNYTPIGGTHVNHVTNQIVKGVSELLEKKHKKIKIKPNDVKNKLFIFLNSKVVNPSFDSQTKENLTTRLRAKHISNVNVSAKLIKQLSQSDIVEDILNYIKLREKAELKKLNRGKTSKVKIKKLDDANMAGTNKSENCTIFLAEGDSASSTIITGFSSTGRDYFGVFPLKGKPLNVRKANMKKILENEEIKNIISALGLEFGKEYKDLSELRYGKVVFAGDADCLDGETLIRTLDGDKKLKNITYDDKVLTHKNEYKSILNIIETKKTKYVEIKYNNEIFKFSEYHKLIIYRDGDIKIIFAKDMLNSDFMLLKK